MLSKNDHGGSPSPIHDTHRDIVVLYLRQIFHGMLKNTVRQLTNERKAW